MSFVVRVGDWDQDVEDIDEQEFSIAAVHFHPEYNVGAYLNNDLAVVRLKTPVRLSSRVSPACLPSSTTSYSPGRLIHSEAGLNDVKCVATPALLWHKVTAQGTQSLLLRAFLAFRCVFMRKSALYKMEATLKELQHGVSPGAELTSLSAGTECTISGWGSTGQASGGYSRRLQAATVPILETRRCMESQVYGQDKLTQGMFCAGYLAGGIDSCQVR